MIASVFSNLIILLFPFLCYFAYLVYSKATSTKEKSIFFDFALITSSYLTIKLGNLPIIFAFLVYIPITISIYNKKIISTIINIIIISYYMHIILNINIFIFVAGYLLITMLAFNYKKYTPIIFTIVNFIYIFMICIFANNIYINFDNTLFIMLFLLMVYVVSNISIITYDKFKNIYNTYESLEKITKEKKLYESLFKITHEIKNPLAVCKGYLDMFDVNDKKKTNRYVGIIKEEIDRTLLLLNDFSNVSKLDINMNLMDINLLLLDVYEEAKIVLKNVEFKYKTSQEEIYIMGDYNRLKQVLLNIIKNANESIIKNGRVNLTVKKMKDKITITVKDNGCGIKKEDLKNIGKAFYTTKKNGTGLGVCFSKEIIEKHGGTLNYESSGYKKGTTVKITLPLNKAPTY